MSDFVVFGEDWGGLPSSTQHLVRNFLTTEQVMWINSIGLRRPRVSFSDFRRIVRKLKMSFHKQAPSDANLASTNEMFENLTVLNPLALPLPGNRFAAKINRHLLGNFLRKSIKQRGFARPILWISLPTAVDILGEIDERLVVYYCCDDFGALAGVDHDPILQLESRLAQKSDLIIVTNPNLKRKFPKEKTFLIPHGVDYDRFATKVPRPADLETRPKIAGYYGSLSEWIDVELLAETARRLPDWQFVFIGDTKANFSQLQRCPNAVFLGSRPHAELPGYVQHWNVSLIPFRDNAQIRACNPLKLREYLAAGSPIVSTDFPALDGYRDLIHIAATPELFAECIERSQYDIDASKVHQRQARVANESWSARAEEIRRIISHFERKPDHSLPQM